VLLSLNCEISATRGKRLGLGGEPEDEQYDKSLRLALTQRSYGAASLVKKQAHDLRVDSWRRQKRRISPVEEMTARGHILVSDIQVLFLCEAGKLRLCL
jgi:hypothetical protein